MTIRTRKFKSTDREFIISLFSRFSEFELPEWRGREEIDNSTRSSLEEAMDDTGDDSIIIIAEDEIEGPAGFMHLQTQTDYFNGGKHGHISDIAVDKRFEGRGIGKTLLRKAEEWARSKGFGLLTLNVFAGNSLAREVYEKTGFKKEIIKYAKEITN